MKKALQMSGFCLLALIFCSCASGPPTEAFYVRQRIPIEIENGKPSNVDLRIRSPGGRSEVGIQCSPEVWNALTNGTGGITVQLLSSNKGVQVITVPPGFQGQCPVHSLHVLCYLHGNHVRASLQITFPNTPAGYTRADVIVCKMASDTL
jgi:hypothetical protein